MKNYITEKQQDEPAVTHAIATDNTIVTPTKFFHSVNDALSNTLPSGSVIRAIGFDNVDDFLRAGYKVTDGDADAVIARGGEREFAAARSTCGKLILVPTHAFAAAATGKYRRIESAFAVMKNGAKPTAAVFDPADVHHNLASIFGEIAALDLCAYDTAFGATMRGERVDKQLCAEVASLVADTTNALRGREKDKAFCAKQLTAAGETVARLVENHPSLLHASGAAQTAEALRMLCSAEDRPLGMRGETEFMLATVVTDFYIKNLNAKDSEFPPDNGKRIDRVCEYFATDIRHACLHTTPVYPPLKMRLCEYRRDEFRAEQTKYLAEVKRRQNAAWNVFKRLYPDDGYGLKTLIDKTDLPICLALAPDVFAADTMLSFFKQTGRLEKYIV